LKRHRFNIALALKFFSTATRYLPNIEKKPDGIVKPKRVGPKKRSTEEEDEKPESSVGVSSFDRSIRGQRNCCQRVAES
jgi:hypothetical protein